MIGPFRQHLRPKHCPVPQVTRCNGFNRAHHALSLIWGKTCWLGRITKCGHRRQE
jgi:hypothetical protein